MLKKSFSKKLKNIETWARNNVAGIFLFNLILLILALLRFAGYFNPYLPININLIYLTSLVLSIFLLKANSRAIFVVGFLFWIFAGFLKVVQVEVWAERTVEYVFQALVLGTLFLIYETVRLKK